jgi:hypothetical protein
LPSPEFKSKRHDTAMSPVLTFTPPAGVTWNLQDVGTVATLIARLPTANAPKIKRTAAVVGPWSVRFDPTAEDVDTLGAYDVEVEVVRPDNKKITLPTVGFLKWTIAADLDNA